MLNLFNRQVMPSWTQWGILTAPTALTSLVEFPVKRKDGYIYGFFIASGEANVFEIQWTNGDGTYERLIPFISLGVLQTIDYVPLNEGIPAYQQTIVKII